MSSITRASTTPFARAVTSRRASSSSRDVERHRAHAWTRARERRAVVDARERVGRGSWTSRAHADKMAFATSRDDERTKRR